MQRPPRCHHNPTIQKPQSRGRAPRSPPTTAAIRRTTVTSACRSRLRTATPKSHTHVQQVAVGIPVYP